MSDHEIWVSALRDSEGEPGADLQIACSCDVILHTEYDDGRSGTSLTLEAISAVVQRHLADAGEGQYAEEQQADDDARRRSELGDDWDAP